MAEDAQAQREAMTNTEQDDASTQATTVTSMQDASTTSVREASSSSIAQASSTSNNAREASTSMTAQETSTSSVAQDPSLTAPPALSKNALKKQAKRLAWEASAPERRAQSRERRKRQKENQRARKAVERESGQGQEDKKKRVKRRIFPADLLVDCAFDEGMSEKEIHSMAQQLSFCYASNKRSSAPFRSLIFTGPCVGSALTNGDSGKPREYHASAVSEGYVSRLEESTKTGEPIAFSQSRTGRQMDRMGCGSTSESTSEPAGQWRRWKNVSITESGGLSSWLASNPARAATTIYLTADTEETIEELLPNHTYIIGGLVDRNRYKNVCLDRARQLGLRVARLPIDPANLTKKTAEGKVLSSRKVLTVNQVCDILLGWTEQVGRGNGEGGGTGGGEEGQGNEEQHTHSPSWEVALERGLPGRKFERRAGEQGEEEQDQGVNGAKRSLDEEDDEDGDEDEDEQHGDSKEARVD